MANTVVLNGVTLAPTTIEVTVTKVGENKRMADGTMRFFYRSTKRTWVLSWENALASTITTAYSAYASNTAVTYVDEFGSNFTVLSASEFTTNLSAENISANGTFYYSCSFTIEQV